MKKTEIKKLIRESIQEVMTEMGLTSEGKDPTKEEMMDFLQKQFGRYDEGSEFDFAQAMYWFAANYHDGQWSNLYSVLSTLGYRPGANENGPEAGSMAEQMYQALEAEFGGTSHQHDDTENLQEDGAAGGGGAAGTGGGPGPGGMSTTSNVQGYSTPRAFGKKRKIKEEDWKDKKDEYDALNKGWEEAEKTYKKDDANAFYVEYDSERKGENPFMMNGQKFQYVNAIYPSGKKDIGVYAFAGDLVYGYEAWRKRMGLSN